MKTLLYGIVLLVIIGIAGFLYRNVQEKSALQPVATACTPESKICPDGTMVRRTGPDCAFAACSTNNVTVASANIAFALPAGYVADENAADADPTMIGAFIKQGSTTEPVGTIIIRDYPIPSGSTATSVILAHSVKDPSGMPATSMNEFTPKLIGSRTYQSIVLGRFEGVVQSAYFYARSKDVLEFQIIEKGVTDWNKPSLVPDTLPEHQAFLKLLNTLQVSDPAVQATSTPKSS
jgi:hypothetical protein